MDAITTNLLEVCGMVMTACAIQVIVQDKPKTAGDSALLMGSNVSAVSWIKQSGGSRNRRAALAMRLLAELEITIGWSRDARHVSGVPNIVVDGISRWPRGQITCNLQTSVQVE